jgi:hypothetical protein
MGLTMPVILDRITKDVQTDYDGLNQFDKDNLYIDYNFNELCKTHEGLWIAVYREQVIDIAPDIETLLNRVDQKGIPSGSVARRKLIRNRNLIV